MPNFYFPNGKPIPASTTKEFNDTVEKVFGPASANKTFTAKDFEPVISEIFKIPKIFRDMLHLRISKVSRVGVTKS